MNKMIDAPKFNGKLISQMSFGELTEASFKLSQMHTNTMAKREHPKFKEKMKNQPEPPINPAFTSTQNAINEELKSRPASPTPDTPNNDKE